MNGIWKYGVLLTAVMLAGCSYMRPKVGIDWKYSYQRIAPDVYKIHVEESRFASEGDAAGLFRVAAGKVSKLNHCDSYKIRSYSTYLDYAFLGASIPMIEGEITCLHHQVSEPSSYWGG
jgi:hypothetical protein